MDLGSSYTVVFEEEKLGISFEEDLSDPSLPPVVVRVSEGRDLPRDLVESVNGESFEGSDDKMKAAAALIESSGRPITIGFRTPPHEMKAEEISEAVEEQKENQADGGADEHDGAAEEKKETQASEGGSDTTRSPRRARSARDKASRSSSRSSRDSSQPIDHRHENRSKKRKKSPARSGTSLDSVVVEAPATQTEFELTVPAGTAAGTTLQFTTPEGRVVNTVVPQDFSEEGKMVVQLREDEGPKQAVL